MTIARVALPLAAAATFDYWIPDGLPVTAGTLVRVRLARRALVGVVLEIADDSAVDPAKLQPLESLVEGVPALPADLLALAAFVAGYYVEPIGLVLAQMLPPLGARDPTTRRARRAPVAPSADSPTPAIPRNEAQRSAGLAITAAFGAYAPFLLAGVTGSGKTDVYLAAAGEAIARGGQVLMLVPEINLTPQLEQRIAAALPVGRMVSLHSGLAAGERRRHWLAAAAGDADLVVGTRLAVFAPLPRLALVVVDEEHDPSYKQQDGVRYHARDVAVWRSRQRAVPVVLGSATPSLESVEHASRQRYRRLDLPARAVVGAGLPRIEFVPAVEAARHEGLAPALVAAIETRLARGEQSLVFVNRRGFAPSLLCAACGWQAGCPRCSARVVVHRDEGMLRCHHCGHARRLPRACPDCGNVDLLPLGHGTQRLERALAARFPDARIARIDRDSTARRHAFEGVLARIHAGELDILVGTQMLAKGHDFPRLTLVGVLGADNALYSADFRATERLGALLFQVAGRSGRAQLPGEVIVQTDFPAHPLYRALAAHDYDALAAALLAERRVAGLPPFAHLALLAAEAPARATVDAFLAKAHAAGTALASGAGDLEVFAPAPAGLARRAGMERGHVLVRAGTRAPLQRFLPSWHEAVAALPGRSVRWSLDVDPMGFL